MSELLKIENLSLSFFSDREGEEETEVLHDVNLSITRGSVHAVVGESGSGKTVTALSVLRLLEDYATVHTTGKILFEGTDILQLTREQLRQIRGNRIAMVFQEPMTSLNPVYTIGEQLLEPLMLHQKMAREEAHRRAIQLLERTGITEPSYRINAYPHQLSGGQRQRVMIAMALACQPALLIADEPTTALDVTIQNQILELIRDLQREFNMGVLLISHDLPLVRRFADTVSIMHRGRIVEQEKTAVIFATPKADYTKHLLTSIPIITKTSNQQGAALISLKNVHCEFVLKSGWEGFFKHTRKVVKAVDGVSITIKKGSTLGIVGESGSGKSTLAMCILNLIKYKGEVCYHGPRGRVVLSALTSAQMRPLRRELQVVFQDPFSSLSPRLSVEQIISEGLRAHGLGGSRRERRVLVEQALREVELAPDMADRYPHEFSGGQRQRIAIARAVALMPQVLILDEPTSALDVTIQAQIISLLERLQKKTGMTYIFISHDLRVIRALADDLVVMRNGTMVEHGPAGEIFQNPRNDYTKKLFAAAFYES